MLGVLLLDTRTVQRFEGRDFWRVGCWRSMCLSWAVVLGVAMVHGLVTYLIIDADWIGRDMRALTVATMATTALALALLLRRRTAGLLLLALSGNMALVLCADAAAVLHGLMTSVIGYWCGTAYLQHFATIHGTEIALTGILPGALAAVGALAIFGRDIVRYLRG